MAPRKKAHLLKTQCLKSQMRPCSVLLDSTDVVRYFCGEAGQYRYYPDVDIPLLTENTPSPQLELELQINYNLQNISNQRVPSAFKSSIEEILGECNVDEQQSNIIPDIIKCTLKKKDSEVIKCVLKHLNKKAGRSRASKFLCSKCKTSFSNFDFLRRHIRNVHNKIVYCKSCYIFFTCKLDLNQHQCLVDVKKKKKCRYKCDFCNEDIKQKKMFKIHVQKHLHFMRPLKDNEIENVKFFSKIKKSELKKYKVHCTFCCVDYNYLDFFKIHYTECCQNSNYICPFCSLSKYQFDSMTEHFQRHLGFLTKPSPCHLCKSVFLNDVNLTIHIKKLHVHHVDKLQKWEANLKYSSVKTPDIKNTLVPKREEKQTETSDVRENTSSAMIEEEQTETSDVRKNTSSAMIEEKQTETSDVRENTSFAMIEEEQTETSDVRENTSSAMIEEQQTETIDVRENTSFAMIEEEQTETSDVKENTSFAMIEEEQTETSDVRKNTSSTMIKEKQTGPKVKCLDDTQVSDEMDCSGNDNLISCKLKSLQAEEICVEKKIVAKTPAEEMQEMDVDERKCTEIKEQIIKKADEVPIEELSESLTLNTKINTQKSESETESDNSEKENQGLKSVTNIQEKLILNKQSSRLFIKTCKNIKETSKKVAIKFHCTVMCLQCKEDFTLETYLNHLEICLHMKDFKCSFCCNKLVKTGIEKRWNHIKNHLSRSKNTESICDMCELDFINDFNMAEHAQNTHFM